MKQSLIYEKQFGATAQKALAHVAIMVWLGLWLPERTAHVVFDYLRN